jgi:hypothetical protein
VAIGAVERRRRKDEEQIGTTHLTYFARMANAATFADQASAEVRRRGIERAKEVCAIQDGAEWIQDGCRKAIGTMRCASSTRAPAAGYLSEIADKVRNGGGHLPAKWVDGVLHRLKHEGPAQVLRHVSRLARRSPQIQEQVTYVRDPTRADGLSHLPTAGLADWVGERGKRSHVADASPFERARHALETRARQSHAGPAAGAAQASGRRKKMKRTLVDTYSLDAQWHWL